MSNPASTKQVSIAKALGIGKVFPKNPRTSIDRVHPRKTATGYTLRWRIKLPSGRTLDRRTQAPSIGECRRRAHEAASLFLATPGNCSFTPQSSVESYMETVVLPAIENASIAHSTKSRYEICFRLLMGQCGGNVRKRAAQCHHRYSLAGLSIYDATRPRNIKACLEEIAKLHGKRNAEQAKTVYKKFVCQNLLIDELIEFNPVSSIDLNFSQARPVPYRRGGRALSLPDYRRVIEYLLTTDPASVEDRSGRQGRWGTDFLTTERSILIDFVLCQATTGLRTSELASRTGETAEVDADFTVIFSLSPEETKTRSGRQVPIIDPRVSQRIAARLAALPDPSFPLFPSPEDPSKVWEPSSRNRRIAAFYRRMANDLDLPVFLKERGHFWRSCLNTILFDALPEATRTRLLGHTSAVNRRSYTAVTDTHSVVSAASAVLLPTVPSTYPRSQ